MSDRTSTTTASKEERAATALARSEMYLFLARSFAYPRGPLQEFYSQAVEATALLDGDIRKRVTQLEVPAPGAEEAQYIKAFGHTMPKTHPLYEAEYGQGQVFMQAQTLASIGGFYRAFGVEAARGERLDHLSTELEFMYFLAYREAYALTSGREEGANLCREGERRFLEKHLGRWAPLCLRRLEQRLGGFYRQLAGVTACWLRAEVEELGARPSALGEEVLAPSQAGDGFFDCLGSGLSPCEEQP